MYKSESVVIVCKRERESEFYILSYCISFLKRERELVHILLYTCICLSKPVCISIYLFVCVSVSNPLLPPFPSGEGRDRGAVGGGRRVTPTLPTVPQCGWLSAGLEVGLSCSNPDL